MPKPDACATSPKNWAKPCCGFSRRAQAGDPLAEGLGVYFGDTGRMVCHRCILAALAYADDELRARRRRARRGLA